MAHIYIMLTSTPTTFAKLISMYTKEKYVHVSLVLEDNLCLGYSFGRRRLNNPFIGGFITEDYHIWADVFPSIECRFYRLDISKQNLLKVQNTLQEFHTHKEHYHYNLRGIIAYILGRDITFPNRFFCSQFVGYVLTTCQVLRFSKKPNFLSAKDFMTHPEFTELLFEGLLSDFLQSNLQATLQADSIKQVSSL